MFLSLEKRVITYCLYKINHPTGKGEKEGKYD